MKTLILISIFSFLIISCATKEDAPAYEPREDVEITLNEFTIKGTTIRALVVLNDSVVWFAGSHGKWGYTLNNGKDWIVDSVKHNGKFLEIRSIKVLNNGNVFLVGVANPAVVLKSNNKGLTWKVVYEDTATQAFFDAIDFWDDSNGLLLGDPINNCFQLATTKDGGETWQKISCNKIPVSLKGEGPFAASNTNIALSGNKAWFGTGGKSESRVYFSENKGENWTVVSTPIVAGAKMKGIYSIDFYDEKNGIIAGGNWDSVIENHNNLAVTKNGGKTWTIVGSGQNEGYISCVQYIPETEGKEIFTLKGRARGGASSMSLFNDNGKSWQVFSNTNYISIQFVNRNTAWLSGKNKIAKMTLRKKR